VYEPIEEVYFNWLYTNAAGRPGHTPSTDYQSLFYVVHSTEFVWTVPGDDNRADEGRELRRLFLAQTGIEILDDPDDTWMNLGCSVLEMLHALAKRCAFQTTLGTQEWFWIFLENLGISEITESCYRENAYLVAQRLETFVWRNYDRKGVGGIFPLYRSRRDQRRVELWYQFNEYIEEYGID
jgi:hypothetical protein